MTIHCCCQLNPIIIAIDIADLANPPIRAIPNPQSRLVYSPLAVSPFDTHCTRQREIEKRQPAVWSCHQHNHHGHFFTSSAISLIILNPKCSLASQHLFEFQRRERHKMLRATRESTAGQGYFAMSLGTGPCLAGARDFCSLVLISCGDRSGILRGYLLKYPGWQAGLEAALSLLLTVVVRSCAVNRTRISVLLSASF